ncbi:hypothetical protein [Nocardia vermiculata]|uniref:Bacterial toxin 24 domain-containing protein n=1 Tax=Nocardia vermiculata TaxID=257274 RepID=A0A846XVE7_9NOCA|nr:hypothetical protein [Nocardia vermiculata]NKY49714.1 hypothetical protein [Nocardia vermiculata]
MIVDWQTYYDAAAQCHQLASDLRAADKPVHEAVKHQCEGMAGNAAGCVKWAEVYDRSAQHTLQVSASLANALTNYGAVLYAQGYNWGIANKSNPPPPRPNTGQVGEYSVVLPTSVGDNGAGFEHSGGVKQFFDDLVKAVIEKFHQLPNADASKLKVAHDSWKTFSTHETLTGAAARIDTISALFDGVDDPTNRTHIQDHFTTLKSSATSLTASTTSVATSVGKYHDATVAFGDNVATKINWLEAGIAAAAVAGIALAIFTVGMSAEVAGEGIAAAVTATIGAIENAFTGSALAGILGAGALVGGVIAIDAFTDVPEDLEREATKLAAIIAMKVLIDGEDDDSTESKTQSTAPPRPEHVPEDWVPRRADNDKGWVWQKPGSERNENMFRDAEPTDRYPDGYVRYYNKDGQPVDLNGKPGSKASTHIPKNPDGTYPVPKGW